MEFTEMTGYKNDMNIAKMRVTQMKKKRINHCKKCGG